VAASDYTQDVSIGAESMNTASQAYRKIRNTIRFLLSVTGDFDPAPNAGAVVANANADAADIAADAHADAVAGFGNGVLISDLRGIDRWMLHKTAAFAAAAATAFDKHDFCALMRRVIHFVGE
jgi:isoleucyl-tRNA synthetase